MLSIRDSRVHENDPLLGMVYLPLGKVLRERSQLNSTYPIVGGIGYGRIRVSLVFRSMQLQAPRELLGWDFGTLEITSPIVSKDLPSDLHGLRLKLRSSINHGKMYPDSNTNGESHWRGKHDRAIRLAVHKRYCSCFIIELRKHNIGLDKTPAFAILWLKDIPDEEECTVTLPVWKCSSSDQLKRAEANCIHELGEKLGTIKVPLKLWRGLGAYHHSLASENPPLQDVFEVLATANDNKEVHTAMGDGDESESNSNDSEDDEGRNTADGLIGKLKSNGKSHTADGANGDEGAKNSGLFADVKTDRVQSNQLHRRHRGIMQWKGARTAEYLKTKVEHGKDHVLDRFKHHERNPGLETEV